MRWVLLRHDDNVVIDEPDALRARRLASYRGRRGGRAWTAYQFATAAEARACADRHRAHATRHATLGEADAVAEDESLNACLSL
jgi:hypothetical protein